MQCRTCGTALQAGAVFCSNCGTPVASLTSAQAAPTPPLVVIKSASNAPGGAPSPIPAAAQQLYAALPQHQHGPPQYPPSQGAPSSPYSPVQPLAQPVPPPPPLSPQYGNLAQGPHLAHPVEHPAASEHEKTGTPDAHEEHEENANERLILFSDGVIAFALTLSAISIKIPTDSAALNLQSLSITIKYLTYIVSFIIVALSWNEHHRMFHHIKRNSMPMVILNFVYLASITILDAQIEFPSFAGNAPTEEVQRVITESLPLLLSYAIGFVVMGAYWLFHYRMFRYINRHNPWLIALNFCFLLCIVLMFAPINYYAAYHSQDATASFLFSLYQVITALILVLLWRYASRKRRLLDHTINDAQVRQFGARITSNLVILFILTLITLFFPIAPLVYLFLYVVAIGLTLLIVHVRKPRAQAQQIQEGAAVLG
jgi:uncharacterized membrane protein